MRGTGRGTIGPTVISSVTRQRNWRERTGLSEAHPDDRAKTTEALDVTLKEGTAQQMEYRAQRKDGSWVDLQAETIGVLDPEGRVESVLLLAIDVTEKKKLEEALALASTEATGDGFG